MTKTTRGKQALHVNFASSSEGENSTVFSGEDAWLFQMVFVALNSDYKSANAKLDGSGLALKATSIAPFFKRMCSHDISSKV